jgi:hypothetical protein
MLGELNYGVKCGVEHRKLILKKRFTCLADSLLW